MSCLKRLPPNGILCGEVRVGWLCVLVLGRRATAEGRSAMDGISTANSFATVGAGSGVFRS